MDAFLAGRTSRSISEGASMFEDSLVESRVAVVSLEKRWTAVASVALQVSLAAVVIAVPLLHPEALPIHVDAPKVLLPLMPKPPVTVVETERAPSGSTSNFAPPSESPRLIFVQTAGAETAANDAPSLAPIGVGMSGPTGMPVGLGIEGPGLAVSVVTPKPQAGGPLRISSGLSEGMLLAPIRPVYPA